MREWIKRALVVEREGRLYATDALEEALRFVTALGDRVMTSTASRLSVVQREIENVEVYETRLPGGWNRSRELSKYSEVIRLWRAQTARVETDAESPNSTVQPDS